jgi:hypothetical protein
VIASSEDHTPSALIARYVPSAGLIDIECVSGPTFEDCGWGYQSIPLDDTQIRLTTSWSGLAFALATATSRSGSALISENQVPGFRRVRQQASPCRAVARGRRHLTAVASGRVRPVRYAAHEAGTLAAGSP